MLTTMHIYQDLSIDEPRPRCVSHKLTSICISCGENYSLYYLHQQVLIVADYYYRTVLFNVVY